MRNRANGQAALWGGVGSVAGVGLLCGCAQLFDVERAAGVLESPDETAGGGNGSLGRQGELPAEEEPASDGVGRDEQQPVTEPADEVPVPEGREEQVQTGASRLPQLVGLENSSVYVLTAQGSTMTATVSETGLCIEGTAILLNVPGTDMPDFANSWGAALKVYTNGWEPGDALVEGLSFDVVGELVPEMRFQGFSSTAAYCVAVGRGTSEVPFSELLSECYDPGDESAFFADPVVTAFEWQVYSTSQGPKDFDFCIENIRPIYADQAAP